MPEAGANAIAVLKLNFQAEIDPGDYLRDGFRRKTQRGQRGFKIDAQPLGHDIASSVAVFVELERKLLVSVGEEAGVAS